MKKQLSLYHASDLPFLRPFAQSQLNKQTIFRKRLAFSAIRSIWIYHHRQKKIYKIKNSRHAKATHSSTDPQAQPTRRLTTVESIVLACPEDTSSMIAHPDFFGSTDFLSSSGEKFRLGCHTQSILRAKRRSTSRAKHLWWSEFNLNSEYLSRSSGNRLKIPRASAIPGICPEYPVSSDQFMLT